VTSLDDARSALRVRLGSGARYDDTAAPAQELAWARLGTAYFARKLNELSNADLSEPNQGLGYERRRTVAEVSYEARALAQYIEWARQRNSNPEADPFAAIEEDVSLAVTLPLDALRHLFAHSEIHLNVEWRDLDAVGWEASFPLRSGLRMVARDTPFIRARTIWLSAVDLHNGGAFDDFPPDFIDALLAREAKGWSSSRSYRLLSTDRTNVTVLGDAATALPVTGTAANLARWICGRGVCRLAGNF
jgi:maleylpyruvate isomerase